MKTTKKTIDKSVKTPRINTKKIDKIRAKINNIMTPMKEETGGHTNYEKKENKPVEVQAKVRIISSTTSFWSRLKFLFCSKELPITMVFISPEDNKEKSIKQSIRFGNEEELKKNQME